MSRKTTNCIAGSHSKNNYSGKGTIEGNDGKGEVTQQRKNVEKLTFQVKRLGTIGPREMSRRRRTYLFKQEDGIEGAPDVVKIKKMKERKEPYVGGKHDSP